MPLRAARSRKVAAISPFYVDVNHRLERAYAATFALAAITALAVAWALFAFAQANIIVGVVVGLTAGTVLLSALRATALRRSLDRAARAIAGQVAIEDSTLDDVLAGAARAELAFVADVLTRRRAVAAAELDVARARSRAEAGDV
ncbi:MAG: hypothetical protein H6698_03155 [Myxococcales bacterium]|nr:hypothetical protein [Myxococcales bacterium]